MIIVSHYTYSIKINQWGVKLLVKPTVPAKPDPVDANRTVLNTDGEEWIMYQQQLKKIHRSCHQTR